MKTVRIACLALAATAAANAQFQLLVTQSGQSSAIENGGAISMFANIGQTQTARVTVTYTGTGRLTVAEGPTLVGSTAFAATLAGPLPFTLSPSARFTFDIRYQPTAPAIAIGQLNLLYSEAVTRDGLPTVNQGTLRLNLSGTSPRFILSYTLQSDPNTVPLGPGASIVFPPTLTNTTAQATLTFTNSGSGPGTITGISLTGAAFRLAGVPLLPFSVASGSSLQIPVQYRPGGTGADTGQIDVTFEADSAVAIPLRGSGSSSAFTYVALRPDSQIPVESGGTVNFPQTRVGQNSSVVMRVSNTGNATGTLNGVSLAGSGYQISGLPALPLTLAPGATAGFTVVFTPTQPGTIAATLFINSDSINLTGLGLGPQLTFSYPAAGSTITISPSSPSVVFSPVQVSRLTEVTFTTRNTGTLPAVISNIGVAQLNSPFSLGGLPALPASLAPDAEFSFTVVFAPTTVGFSNATLQIDAAAIPLLGSGTAPPLLPAYTITGPSGTVAPLTQPGVTLTLASPYPVALAGTLTLTASSNVTPDPAVQFATGGQVVQFVIPANTTSALFGAQGNQGNRIGLQTGTVANSFVITPAFATRTGGVELTPANVVTAQFNVAAAAPTVLSVVAPAAGNVVNLAVTGYSTSRSLTSMVVQLNPAPGVSIATNRFTIELQQVAASWFRGTASQPFGGQFTIGVPFSFQGLATDQRLAAAIASVTVTLTNDQGTSSSVQAQVQ